MPIVETIAAAGSIATIARTLADAAGAARKAGSRRERGDALDKVHELVMSLQSATLDLQAKLLELQAENAKLMEENAQLATKLRADESWSKERKKYQRKQVRSTWVMVREDSPDSYYCPTCFQQRQANQLQPSPVADVAGSHICWTCKGSFDLR